MQVTDKNGNIFGPHGLQVNGPDGKPKVISGGGGSASIPHGTASGTDTYTVSITGVSSYSDGDAYLVRFTNGNTTGATLNINGLGAVTLYRNNDGQIIGGDIEDGSEMLCIYNSTSSVFQLIGTSPNTLLAYVTNSESITITKGQPVYAFGGQGDRLKVKLAYNATDATSAQTVGLVLSSSIGANQKGFIILNGQLDGLSILPTSTWADGDPVYLGATAGSITNIKPQAPNHLVYLGFVTTANNGSAGRMYVRVQNGYELEELHDVQISSPLNGDLLQYELSTDLWKNRSLSGAGIQPTLVSGTNIKTIASNSLVGSGDVPLKTINGAGLVGSGNIVIASSPYTLIGNQTGAYVTGTTANTASTNQRIFANTTANGNVIQVRTKVHKINSTTSSSIRMYINTTNSLTGATLIATAAAMNILGIQSFWRDFLLSGNQLYCYNPSNAISSDITFSSVTLVSFNPAVDNYIIFAVQNSATADSVSFLKTSVMIYG
jgi:hypothetical protein